MHFCILLFQDKIHYDHLITSKKRIKNPRDLVAQFEQAQAEMRLKEDIDIKSEFKLRPLNITKNRLLLKRLNKFQKKNDKENSNSKILVARYYSSV
jgi:hypothetical protein